jgi:hypothetical protein
MSDATVESRQTRSVAAYGRVVAIEWEGAPFALPFLPFEWGEISPDQQVDRRYTAAPAGGGQWALSIDGEHPVTLSNAEALADHIEGDLHHWLATFTRGYLFVHAGCVGWRGRAIVIPGRSHAGKTTLTRALLDAGAVYYSDDYAVIAPDGSIHPFPRRLHVRPDPPGPAHRLDPSSGPWRVGHEPIRAALVAAVRYDRDRGWEIETLNHGRGALALLDNTVAARERPQDALRIMTHVMSRAEAIQGTRDEAAAAAERLLRMVDAMLDSGR